MESGFHTPSSFHSRELPPLAQEEQEEEEQKGERRGSDAAAGQLLIKKGDKSCARNMQRILTGSADSRSDDRVLGVPRNGPWDDLVQL